MAEDPSADEKAARHRYFCFILASTAARSFEAGIISSMLEAIKADLDIDYLREGVVASAPDFGIVPASILALWIFDVLPAFPVLATSNCIIGVVTFTCALVPSFASLVAARAISGLCWGLSAVHYPAWINSKGDPKRRTSWLALCVPLVLSRSLVVSQSRPFIRYNAMLLVGILVGYVIGGACLSEGWATWHQLYAAEGCFMLAVALGSALFSPATVQVVPRRSNARAGDLQSWSQCWGSTANEEKPILSDDDGTVLEGPKHARDFRTKIGELVSAEHGLFGFTIGCGAMTSGTIGFILYFITEVTARLMSNLGYADVYLIIGVGMVTAPIPGTLLGGRYLEHISSRGYHDFFVAHGFTVACSVSALACVALLPLATSSGLPLRDREWLFSILIWLILFIGAAPTASLNGIAIAVAPPDASHYASSVQFAVQNLAKMMVPIFGGWLIDATNLFTGFDITMAITVTSFLFFALLARRAAGKGADAATPAPASTGDTERAVLSEAPPPLSYN